MGGEPVRTGKYVFLCFALLSLLPSCSVLKDWSDQREIHASMLQGQALLERGDFEGSLRQYQKVLSLAGADPPADGATFAIGLIYAHPQNPQKNNEKALGSFTRVIDGHPYSSWVEQAKIWTGVLREIEKSRHEIERAKEVIEKSRQEVERARQIIEKSKQVDIEIEQKRRERGR
jgi:tetratricopeptide (TPR) repeat protein